MRLVMFAGAVRDWDGTLAEELVVDPFNLLADISPYKVRKNCCLSVSSELICQGAILQESDNAATQCLVVMVRHNERVIEVAHTFGRAAKTNNRLAGQHVV